MGAVGYGLVLRLWLLAHLAFESDEAVVGLMGRQILSGHPTVFYWGSFYGGIEAYVVAPAIWLFGSTPTVVNATPAFLAGLGALGVGAVVALAGGGRRLSALAAALVWVWPYAAAFNSVRELGLRGVTLCCGLGLLLCALALERGHRHVLLFAGLGLSAGLGWWASPEIVYFGLPALLLLAASWRRLFERDARWSRPRPWRLLVALAGAAVGVLPWLVANIRSGFTSLHAGALGSTAIPYGSRLGVFFAHVLPTQLGLQGVPDGHWVGGASVGPILYGILLALVGAGLGWAALEVARRGRPAAPAGALAVAVVAFPFLYALFPNAGYWTDGRYGVYLAPLLVLLWGLGLSDLLARPPRPRPRRRRRPSHAATRSIEPPLRALVALGACLAVAGATALTAGAAQSEGVPPSPSALVGGVSERGPNGLASRAAAGLEAAHVRRAFATYWMAYVIDFLTHDRVLVTPVEPLERRNEAIFNEVARSAHPAYLFYAPGHLRADTEAFANDQTGPAGMNEKAFIGWLEAQSMPFRVIHAGLLDAVVPAGPLATFP